ncbi:hypothetical protein [Chitinophaga polysaccharea]|uniref:hypothetical protein n=1 Tax=Chitinophaga polysaccharea TaxID=1293035 RepID=UPI00115A8A0E|nr:hypothetical protein [Chitinophaga polysaccharea]
MFTATKYIGIALVLAGIPVLWMNQAQTGAELPLITGLFLIFFSREKTEDERSQSIRANALMISFALGYIIEVTTTYLHNKGMLTFQLSTPRYFIMLVLILGILIFYTKLFFTGSHSK